MKSRKKRTSSWRMQAFTNTISTTMVLILLGMVVLLMLTANVISDSVKENLVVTVVLQEDTPTEEAQALQKKLCAKTYVKSIEYVSKEQALKEHVESILKNNIDECLSFFESPEQDCVTIFQQFINSGFLSDP